MKVAKRYSDELGKMKENVQGAYTAFSSNYESFNHFKRFVFVTTLSDKERALLKRRRMPQIEVNIIEAFISRLMGEFSKQEPSFEVSPCNPNKPANPQFMSDLEGHLIYLLREANEKCQLEYMTYKDSMGGGFAVLELGTEYAGRRRFDQKFFMVNPYDATMVFFDSNAREPSKCDGEFCGKLYPLTQEELKKQMPGVDISKIQFQAKGSSSIGGFNWATKDGNHKCILVCDYYKKKYKTVRIVELANGEVLTKEQYDEMANQWQEAGLLAQLPIIVQERDDTDITICRYRFIENQVLDYKETDYPNFPLIFVDGNSTWIRKNKGGSLEQITKPFAWNAHGIQRLKNFGVQNLANELENMLQQKWKAPIEGMPEKYADDYMNPQDAQVILYHAFDKLDPNKAVPPPMEVQRIPPPPEVMGTVSATDQMMQMSLGTFDAAQGQISRGQLSGEAIFQGGMQSNAASMPYLVNFMYALTAAAQWFVDMFPKIYLNQSQMPTIGKDGKKSSVPIYNGNQEGNQGQPQGHDMGYDAGTFNVMATASVNFTIQKNRALEQMISLMGASPFIQEYIGTTPEGLDGLLSNIEIKGQQQFKDGVIKYTEQKQQQMQQAQQQQAQQPNPAVMAAQNQQQRMQIEQEKLRQKAQQDELDNQKDMLTIAQKQQELDNEQTRLTLQAAELNEQSLVQKHKLASDNTSKAIQHALAHEDQKHRHAKETVELHHMITAPQPEPIQKDMSNAG